jgi:membrane protein YdbS with pleckstrin-like domain
MRASTVAEGRTPMIPFNTQLGLPSRAFWYIALRSLVVAFLVLLLGSVVQLISTLPGATCGGHPCNPASGAHLAAFVYLFAAFLVLRAVLSFKWFTFVLTDRNLTIDSGVLARSSNTVRFDRIQDVNTRRDPLHALLGLKSVDIWTGSPDQFAGNRRRPEGHLVLEAEDADWLRDYLSAPPAAAGAGASGAKAQPAPAAGPRGGNGAVVVAVLIAAGLVVLAAMAAMKKSPPMPATADTGVATAPAPAYVPKRGADGKTHLHLVHTAPGPSPQSAASASAAAPPPVAPVQVPASDYGIACAVHPQQATAAVRSCAELPTAQRCSHEGDFASRPTAEPAVLTVINKSDESVRFYWLNATGNRALYATLPPGGRIDQPSHAGAHWLVSAADGRCLGVFDAANTKVGIF